MDQDKDMPKCPFCGRRKTVKNIEDDLYFCSHCQKMFRSR